MMPVNQYEKKLIKTLGFASPILLREYAEARQKWKREKHSKGDFNPFTQDPNCKNCGKK